MHHQSKARKMSKSQQKKKKKFKKKKKNFFLKIDTFGLARFRFNEVRINEVPLYYAILNTFTPRNRQPKQTLFEADHSQCSG